MRSMQSTSSSSLLPRSLSHYEKLTTARLLQKKEEGGLFFSANPMVLSAQTGLNCLLLFLTPILTF